jgi:hypothetical protein
MRGWVIEAEHLLDGSWAMAGEAVNNEHVGQLFDHWRTSLAEQLTNGTLSELEQECLRQFLQVLSNMRPYLIQCYDRETFPRTNNDTERAIRGLKTCYRRISGRKIGMAISCGMGAASLSTRGGNRNQTVLIGLSSTSNRFLQNGGGSSVNRPRGLRVNNSSAFVFVASGQPISPRLRGVGR